MSSTSGWEVRFSNSRQLPYFYNSNTGTSVWEKPEEISEDEIASLPGAQYLKSTSNGPITVRASHLLVKHNQSRRPGSWKESNITRSPEEAEDILKRHAATLGPNPNPEEFASLAKVHSDGDLGVFGRGTMQKPFEEAVFSLPIGAMSDVVKTESGHHLILRMA